MRTIKEWANIIYTDIVLCAQVSGRAPVIAGRMTAEEIAKAIQDEVWEKCCDIVFKEGVKFAYGMDVAKIVLAIKNAAKEDKDEND